MEFGLFMLMNLTGSVALNEVCKLWTSDFIRTVGGILYYIDSTVAKHG